MENYIPDKLEQSAIYKTFLQKCNISRESNEISTVNNAVKYACDRLKLVLKIMPGYTLHDEVHSFKMLSIMGKLIPQATLDQLDVPELMLLILSAFFHDLGMVPNEKDINIWQGKFDQKAATPEELEQNKQFENFKRSNY